jgi:hypothetical protein
MDGAYPNIGGAGSWVRSLLPVVVAPLCLAISVIWPVLVIFIPIPNNLSHLCILLHLSCSFKIKKAIEAKKLRCQPDRGLDMAGFG